MWHDAVCEYLVPVYIILMCYVDETWGVAGRLSFLGFGLAWPEKSTSILGTPGTFASILTVSDATKNGYLLGVHDLAHGFVSMIHC